MSDKIKVRVRRPGLWHDEINGFVLDISNKAFDGKKVYDVPDSAYFMSRLNIDFDLVQNVPKAEPKGGKDEKK